MNTVRPNAEQFLKLSELLKQRIGLNSDSVGKQTLQHAVEHRLKALHQHNVEQYVSRLISDTAEWNEFLEEIIVPESWFFRELTPFRCAREFAREAIAKAARSTPLRFLSIPCSRGEEPYSLAMTLLDAGLLPTQFEIVACDLSQRSLNFARTGCYRAIAFRETDDISQKLTKQHFVKRGEEFELHANIRSKVRFQQANLAQTETFKGLGQFDWIFCRNVLIYLTEDVRQRTLLAFKRMLQPGGLLYLGHSECRLGPQVGARVWKDTYPAAFCWDPIASSPSSRPSPTLNTRSSFSIKPESPTAVQATKAEGASAAKRVADDLNSRAPKSTIEGNALTNPTHGLARAKELANGGKLDEAEALCQAIIKNEPSNADAYCLLGVIIQARGDLMKAESCYHKSLFLKPDHIESLTHSLLLARLRGDTKHVANYQRRLDRLRHQGT